MHEAIFYFLICATLATTYSRLRLLDLTAGFWAVITPHVIHGLSVGKLSPFDTEALILVGAYFIQVGMVLFNTQLFLRRKEVYALFTFFLSLILGAAAALWLLPSFTAILPSKQTTPLGYVTAFLTISTFIAFMRASSTAARTSFSGNLATIGWKDRLSVAGIVAVQIILWCLYGWLFLDAHRGLIASAEIISIICIVSVAGVKPSSAGRIIASAFLASAFVLVSYQVTPPLHMIAWKLGSTGFFIDVKAFMLLTGIACYVFFGRYVMPGQPRVPKYSALVENTASKAIFGSVALIVTMYLVTDLLYPVHTGKLAHALTLIGFGALTYYVNQLTGVHTILIPTISFSTLLLMLRIISADIGDPLFSLLLVALFFVTVAWLLASLLRLLRSLPLDQAVLVDLVLTFSIASIIHSVSSVSGTDGFLVLATQLTNRVGLFGLMFVSAVLSCLPFLFRRSAGSIHAFRRTSKTNVYAFSLMNPGAAEMHGFNSRLIFVLFVGIVLVLGVSISAFEAIRGGGIAHSDYGLIPGLQVLAIAIISARSPSLFVGIAVSIALSAPMMIDSVLANGLALQLIFGALALSTLIISSQQGERARG